ncbi:carbamate kinase [bacterium]|nr:carbamate kinase [bacterium]MCI0604048.1 carbamate kinase [bacterium]
MRNPVAVIAFGGNAILKEGERGTQEEQIRHCDEAADLMAQIVQRGYDLVIVHGNGPQVGNILIQMEEAVNKVPPFSLDVCVAVSEGSMGYLLERSLRNQFRKRSLKKEAATLITQVMVDPRDPAFENPSKPIGPFFTAYRAAVLKKEKRWPMVEDSGRGYRRVVASPLPQRIINLEIVKSLINNGTCVIAAGGGGIPAYYDGYDNIKGVEAVIDKDYTSSLIASELRADLFVILTNVEFVSIHFGKKNQKNLTRVRLKEMKRFYDRGHFPPGSMGPKIKAAIDFIENGGKEVIVTSAKELIRAMKGQSGTHIVR